MKRTALSLALLGFVTVLSTTRATAEAQPFRCTVDGGTQRVASLLAAFSSEDEAAVRALITRPSPKRDGLELAPTFTAFAKGGSEVYHSVLPVHSRAQLRAFMRAIAGHDFEVVRSRGVAGTVAQSGPGAWTGPAVSLQVDWRARGDSPSMKGHRYVSGSSKILVTCPDGRVRRGLFSPNAYGATPRAA